MSRALQTKPRFGDSPEGLTGMGTSLVLSPAKMRRSKRIQSGKAERCTEQNAEETRHKLPRVLSGKSRRTCLTPLATSCDYTHTALSTTRDSAPRDFIEGSSHRHSRSLLPMFAFSVVSVTCSQPWSKTIR